MAIIKLKPKQTFSCSFCKEIGCKTPARWRMYMSVKFSCDKHKNELVKYEEDYFKTQSDDYSEADYQTWLKM